jgi:hypothetical protein
VAGILVYLFDLSSASMYLVKQERSGALKMLVWSKHICIFLVHVFHEVFYF